MRKLKMSIETITEQKETNINKNKYGIDKSLLDIPSKRNERIKKYMQFQHSDNTERVEILRGLGA